MTYKKDFRWIWSRLLDCVMNSKDRKIADVNLMEKLNFSPPSWKVWKPMFIEKSKQVGVYKNESNKKIGYMILYIKKEKIWKAISLGVCDHAT